MLQCNRPEEADAKAEGVLLTSLRNERVPRPITMNNISTCTNGSTLVFLLVKLGMAPGETGMSEDGRRHVGYRCVLSLHTLFSGAEIDLWRCD